MLAITGAVTAVTGLLGGCQVTPGSSSGGEDSHGQGHENSDVPAGTAAS
jgi:hypothetical protein